MGSCIHHPDRETLFQCMKHNVWLCEECLKCRDSELYCKHRSACPIWFIEKRQKRLAREQAEAAALRRFQVTFEPGARAIEVPVGSTLLEAARSADIHLNASCNGKGLCGKCKLVVESGEIESEPTALLSDAEKQRRYVLACQSRLRGDALVRIPAAAIERKLKVAGMGRDATERLQGLVAQIDPMLREIPLELSPPAIEDAVSDHQQPGRRGARQRGGAGR
jgi:ferredoxin